MLQKRDTPSKLLTVAAALKPNRVLTGWRYRLQCWRAPRAKKAPILVQRGLAAQGPEFREMSFTFAVIALAARLASVDGNPSQNRYLAFRESFPLQGRLCGTLRSLFALACDNPTPYVQYVSHIRYAFPRQKALFTSLIERLCHIAAADGPISPAADRMLATVAHLLELSPADYARIRAGRDRPKAAHDVLGLRRRPTREMLKERYRQLMRLWHPDRFAGGLSPEIRALLTLKASEINEAYRALSRRAA